MDSIVQPTPDDQPAAALALTLVPNPELARQVRARLASADTTPGSDDYVRAWWDWYLGLAGQPEMQLALVQDAIARGVDLWRFALFAAAGQPLAHDGDLPQESQDPHFANEAWNQFPYNLYARGYTQLRQWSQSALHASPEMAPQNAQRLDFLQRQLLDTVSPAHYLLTNPELLEQTRSESGANLMRGAQYWLEDAARMISGGAAPGTENFRVGEQVAATPGKIVMRNALVELIQYSAQGTSVYAEPILITPAWIMKYYILDLSARNSLVKYLVEQGHTVFIISWKNPTATDRDLGMDDYVELGLRAALDAVSAIVPGQRVHTVGYCIGGTLLSIGAATLAREGDRRIASVTLLAAQTDFSEPGELSVFVSPSQLALLEAQMQRDGVLKSESMGAAFAMLRSSDLIWAPAVNQYVRGERAAINDLMAWNADGTRMPCRMHSEYLNRLYLRNEIPAGRFTVRGQTVNLGQIEAPLFLVGTETDHVAPWRSAYKTRALTGSHDSTFVLTSGGHNAGIISGAANPKRRHRVMAWADASIPCTPDEYLRGAELRAGSWWPTWEQWLVQRSTAARTAPPPMGNTAAGYPPLCDAPGGYVRG